MTPSTPSGDEDPELYFDFALSSPSSDFYKKQAARGPKAVVSFEAQYNKIPSTVTRGAAAPDVRARVWLCLCVPAPVTGPAPSLCRRVCSSGWTVR